MHKSNEIQEKLIFNSIFKIIIGTDFKLLE